jgi:hypothetical protein
MTHQGRGSGGTDEDSTHSLTHFDEIEGIIMYSSAFLHLLHLAAAARATLMLMLTRDDETPEA